jgi:hypothetical protein
MGVLVDFGFSLGSKNPVQYKHILFSSFKFHNGTGLASFPETWISC